MSDQKYSEDLLDQASRLYPSHYKGLNGSVVEVSPEIVEANRQRWCASVTQLRSKREGGWILDIKVEKLPAGSANTLLTRWIHGRAHAA